MAEDGSVPPSTAPSQPVHPALPSARSFLSLGEDVSLSTRGQRLPSLIQNRLGAVVDIARRNSSTRPTDHGNGGSGADLERGIGHQRGHEADARQQERISKINSERSSKISGDGRGIDMAYGFDDVPDPPPSFPLAAKPRSINEERPERKIGVLLTPQMRSQRLIGNSNPRYKWGQYYKSEAELQDLSKGLRKYYERNNYLIMQYLYIDRLLDSSLPHHLIQEYNTGEQQPHVDVPPTIIEHPVSEPSSAGTNSDQKSPSPPPVNGSWGKSGDPFQPLKVKRTKDIYKVQDEETPLLSREDCGGKIDPEEPVLPAFQMDDNEESGARVVTVAIYINLAANTILLVLKIIVMVLTSSLSVLASLVDGALDFLSTAIVWTTTRLISTSSNDREAYPVGRRRLEPIGVLVFSVIMITSFFQVALEALSRLTSPDHTIVALSLPAIAIMASTVLVKAACWAWCRLIRNSSVQALAQDAITDCVFNTFSILFPLAGYYLNLWYLDPLGGLLLSLYVIVSWSLTSKQHILNLTGYTASADERNILLYLTMRFAHTVKRIQNLSAYHAGDKLNVEVDIVLEESMSLRDSHDLGESLQYVLESVPGVERAFVHADYWEGNLPSHMVE